MNNTYFPGGVPEELTVAQRQEWERRRRMAEHTLDIQILSGIIPDARTISYFQRYVEGEISLNDAVERVRRQVSQEHSFFRSYLDRRHAS